MKINDLLRWPSVAPFEQTRDTGNGLGIDYIVLDDSKCKN